MLAVRKFLAKPFVNVFSQTKLFNRLYIETEFERELIDSMDVIVGSFCLMKYNENYESVASIHRKEFDDCISEIKDRYSFDTINECARKIMIDELELCKEDDVRNWFSIYMLYKNICFDTNTTSWVRVFDEFSKTSVFEIINMISEK